MTARHRTSFRRQRGVAVITAMLVVAVATILAVEIAWQTNLDLRRTEGLIGWDQAHEFAFGAESYAIKLLEEQLDEQAGAQPIYSRRDDETACRGFQFSLDQGAMTGGVCDLQARFNLNNLVTSAGKPDELVVKQFRRLIEAVAAVNPDLDLNPADAEIIVASTVDWIDPDTNADFNGAEDDTYTSEPEPYRAANFWFTSVSELRAVRGVTPEIYAALAPHITALPVANGPGKHTLINVNTASVPVLMSLGDNITVENATRWIENSRETPFKDETSFAGFVDAAMFPYMGYTSAYFELKGFVSIGTTRLGMYSLLESNGQSVRTRLRQFDVVEAVESAEPPTDISADAKDGKGSKAASTENE
jgi:general secretion pathway protein K